MKVNTPTLSLEILTEEALDIYNGLDRQPFGEMLARKVAQKLIGHPTRCDGGYYNGGGLYFAHRDYCGVGLFFFEGTFTLGEVNDSMGPHPILVTFDSEEEFVAWLAKQSDQDMSLTPCTLTTIFRYFK